MPRQVFDNQNLTRHLAELEGDPENRPLTRESSSGSLTSVMSRSRLKQRRHRKGALAAFRDAVLVQGDLRLGAAPRRGGDARCCRLRPEPGGAGVRAVWLGPRPLRQGHQTAAGRAIARC